MGTQGEFASGGCGRAAGPERVNPPSTAARSGPGLMIGVCPACGRSASASSRPTPPDHCRARRARPALGEIDGGVSFHQAGRGSSIAVVRPAGLAISTAVAVAVASR